MPLQCFGQIPNGRGGPTHLAQRIAQFQLGRESLAITASARFMVLRASCRVAVSSGTTVPSMLAMSRSVRSRVFCRASVRLCNCSCRESMEPPGWVGSAGTARAQLTRADLALAKKSNAT